MSRTKRPTPLQSWRHQYAVIVSLIRAVKRSVRGPKPFLSDQPETWRQFYSTDQQRRIAQRMARGRMTHSQKELRYLRYEARMHMLDRKKAAELTAAQWAKGQLGRIASQESDVAVAEERRIEASVG